VIDSEVDDVVGKGVVVVSVEDASNDSVENLIHVLPLVLSFLQALVTNRHSEKGSPQSAELLARIGMSVLEELIDGLSSLDCENVDASDSNFANSSKVIWAHVTGCLCNINEFALSHTFEVVSQEDAVKTQSKVVVNVDDDDNSLSNRTSGKVALTSDKLTVKRNKTDEESEEEEEEEAQAKSESEEEEEEEEEKSIKYVIRGDIMPKFVLALKVAKMVCLFHLGQV
jgi:hypothetical protein